MRRFLDQRLKLRHLRAIDGIAFHGSLQRAAQALAVSQPALSRSLQEAEAVLGARLFDRHPRGVIPTASGDAAWASARRIMAELALLEGELDRLADPASGIVRLGALPVAAVGLLPGVLARLRRDEPGLEVRLFQGRTEELLPMLARAELDLIVGRLYPPSAPDGFQRLALYDEPLSVLARAGHPILDGEPKLADLAGFDLVLPTLSQRMGQELARLMQELGIERPGCLRSSSMGFIRELLQATDTLTIGPRMMMGGDLMRGTVKVVPLVLSGAERPAGIIRGEPGGARLERVVAALRGYIGEMAGLVRPL